jgi:hypothetical protein
LETTNQKDFSPEAEFEIDQIEALGLPSGSVARSVLFISITFEH